MIRVRPGTLTLIAAAFLVLSSFAACRPAERPTGELHVGYMICNSLKETKERFAPLSAYLSDVLGTKVVPHYINTSDFEKEVQKGYLKVAHTNSLLYVIFKENHDWRLLAAEREGSHGSSTAGVVIVRGDSPARSLADLRGKRMMFGPELAPMGFLSQYNMLLDAGVDPERDLGLYAFTRGSFTHEKVVYSVVYGGYDAGSIPLLDIENMQAEAKIRAEDYRILATGPFIPYCTFSTAPDLPAEVREKILKALTGLTRDATARVDGEVLRVLDRAGVEGFEIRNDADYDPIRSMARRANMPPYQQFP
jgi:phosphonate transport system substrate-binding protein